MEEARLYHISEEAKVERMDHLPLIGAMIEKAGIVEKIDAVCKADPQLEISYGTSVKAMILSILKGKYPLYQVSEWIRHSCGELLFGEGGERAIHRR